jgi:hypothetical protein
MDYTGKPSRYCTEGEQLYEVYELYDYVRNYVAKRLLGSLRRRKLCQMKKTTVVLVALKPSKASSKEDRLHRG